MKAICYQQDNGILAVITVSERERRQGESDANLLARRAAEDVPEGKAFTLVDPSNFPADPKYRMAWKLSGTKVVEDAATVATIDTAKAAGTDPVKAVLDSKTETL